MHLRQCRVQCLAPWTLQHSDFLIGRQVFLLSYSVMFMHQADAFIQRDLHWQAYRVRGSCLRTPTGGSIFHAGDLNPGHPHERWQSYHSYPIQYSCPIPLNMTTYSIHWNSLKCLESYLNIRQHLKEHLEEYNFGFQIAYFV